jgi:hypothetical protein
VVETAIPGYAPAPDAIGTVNEETRDVTDANFTNTLVTVSIAGAKVWEDQSNYYGTRPEAIVLKVYADGEELLPQPEIDWTKDGDTWTYAIGGLPRYRTGTEVSIIYSVREAGVRYYLPQEDQAGVVDAETGDITQADFRNKVVSRLEIDNTTVNLSTGQTNAGGFVAVDAAPDERDLDPYQDDKFSVSWTPEQYWQSDATFTVRYLGYDAGEEENWKEVTVSLNDLSALKAISYFADATLERSGDLITLKLAQDAAGMPYQTQVLVKFLPTLAVENTTRSDAGGKVSIQLEEKVCDGRYPGTTAYGKAASGHIVDMDHLQISLPTGVSGSVKQNAQAVTIKPRAKGRFSVTISIEVAGETQRITLSGQVKILKRDGVGNPTKISVTLNGLPVPFDIGIPFIPAPDETGLPQTGDLIPWAVGVFLLSGLAVVLLRRKKT